MFKRIIPSLVLLVLAATLGAQKPVLKISPEFKLPKSQVFQDHLHTDPSGAHYVYYYEYGGGGLMAVNYKVEKLILEKYSPSFKLEYAKEFEPEGKNLATLGVKFFQGKFVWLFSEENKKEDFVRYAIVPIGLDGKAQKKLEIAKIKYDSRDEIPYIYWSVSRDSSKLMVNAVRDDNDDERKVSVFSFVLDRDYSMLWSKKANLPYSEERVSLMKTLLTNNGSVFMLAKVYEGKRSKESKKEKKKSVPAYDVALFQLGKDSEEAKEIKLNLGTSFIRGASLESDNEGNLNCTGFYSNTKGGSLQGVFFLKLSPDGTVMASSKKEFTAADLKTIGKENTDKDKTGDEGLEDNFKFTDFLVKDDGSAVVISEQNYFITRTYYNGRTWQTVTTYYSNDIVFFNITPKGDIERVTVIPKYQVGSTSFFQSYVAMVKDKEVTFFYNEDEDNMKKPVTHNKPKPTGSFKDCIAVMTTLDEKGDLKRKQLFEAKDVESLFVPNNSRQISKNQLFFVSQKFKLFGKSNFHLGTITIP